MDKALFTFANGDKYVSEYRDAKRNGQGTYSCQWQQVRW